MGLLEERNLFHIDADDVATLRDLNDTVERMREEVTRRSNELIENRSDGDFLDQAFEETRVRRMSVEELSHELRG
jgi:hypothetical protein